VRRLGLGIVRNISRRRHSRLHL